MLHLTQEEITSATAFLIKYKHANPQARIGEKDGYNKCPPEIRTYVDALVSSMKAEAPDMMALVCAPSEQANQHAIALHQKMQALIHEISEEHMKRHGDDEYIPGEWPHLKRQFEPEARPTNLIGVQYISALREAVAKQCITVMAAHEFLRRHTREAMNFSDFALRLGKVEVSLAGNLEAYTRHLEIERHLNTPREKPSLDPDGPARRLN